MQRKHTDRQQISTVSEQNTERKVGEESILEL
jgi:hypothetical protein